MSAKPAPKTLQIIRAGIKVQELIDMLQENTLRKGGKPLNSQKLQQIKLLLAKAMPDVKVQEITGQIDSKISISWEGDDNYDPIHAKALADTKTKYK